MFSSSSLRIVHYLEAFSLPERQIWSCSRLIVVQSHKRRHATCKNKRVRILPGESVCSVKPATNQGRRISEEPSVSPARVILVEDETMLLSTPPKRVISALEAADWLFRPVSAVGFRFGVRDCWPELRWWLPAPPPELGLPSRLRVRWPTSLGLLLVAPIAKPFSTVKERETS